MTHENAPAGWTSRCAASTLALLSAWVLGLACAGDAAPTLHCAVGGAGFAFEDTPRGTTVAAVFPGGAARGADLRAGDIVRELGTDPIRGAAHLAAEIGRARPMQGLALGVERGGSLFRITLPMAQQAHAECVPLETVSAAPIAEETQASASRNSTAQTTAERGKAIIAVGGLEVKAAKATRAIGYGLREMMVTALHNSGYFVVVERIALKDLTEHAFVAAQAGARRAGGLEIAELVVFAAITEFEPAAGGSSFMNFMPGVPLGVGAQINLAELALDLRVVDVATGRVLAAQRVPGMARSVRGSIGTVVPLGAVGIPAGLEMYRGTPMEWAVRDCIRKASLSIANTVPLEYFRHE